MQTPTLLNHRYRVIRVLGSGGFGETFLAEDTQMPSGRRCVIKKLKPVENNPQIYQLVQERFQREAAILEELGDGCNQIPKLYAYFVEDDDFFLVQEYIEGDTLQEKLHLQGQLSESSVREILSNILPILDYVHSKRIVHRDIKPENILIRHGDGKPVLIDFGAVKETMGTIMTVSGESSRSIVIGTPGFMPSEQSAGRPVFASDLYSMGLTAIYLLTGKIPQQLETDPGTGDLIWRHHALSVSPSFATLLDKAIASHARDRYSTAKEMLQALQHGATPIAPTIPVSPPTLVSAPPAYVQPQQTVVSAPPADAPYQQPVYSQPPPPVSKGMGDWQKAVIIGGVIGACVIGGLWITRPSQTQNNVNHTEATTSPTTEISPTTTPTPIVIYTSVPRVERTQPSKPPPLPPRTVYPTSTSSITQSEATSLINDWLQAKRVMFAPPYDRQPANQLTTGEEYERVAGIDGSINSLKNDGFYYKYGVQQIDSVDNFTVNGSYAIIKVKITEDRTLFDSNGNIIPKETDFKTRTIRYKLKFVDDRWKIDSKTNLSD
ncbi:protein kinase domain-containing protein [Nostoc sp. UHCC 0870]|uniref:protein kinase domain-containing protein n=1 Tax=Nostoc sp. UHCC 0870 TaxID=2914041 RepID=UPI001EDDD65D|nr:IMS domain-containing protein [Nostoc sp. UHCC 0870]UKO97789.1 IMS domain-containing protein [Nostoc sp. UHCC 0870]